MKYSLLFIILLFGISFGQERDLNKYYHLINYGYGEEIPKPKGNSSIVLNNFNYSILYKNMEFDFYYHLVGLANRQGFKLEAFVAQFGYNFKYFGIYLGTLLAFKSDPNKILNFRKFEILMPVCEIRVGKISDYYLSININQHVISAISMNLNYRFNNAYDYVSFGITGLPSWMLNSTIQKTFLMSYFLE